jgi:hypothetical protein
MAIPEEERTKAKHRFCRISQAVCTAMKNPYDPLPLHAHSGAIEFFYDDLF